MPRPLLINRPALSRTALFLLLAPLFLTLPPLSASRAQENYYYDYSANAAPEDNYNYAPPSSDSADTSASETGDRSLLAPLRRIHGHVLFELQDDWTVTADDEDDERNDLYGTIESFVHIGLTEHIGLETALTFEPVRALDPDEDGSFDNEGLYVDELKLTWQGESLGAFVGKYHPDFGVAWKSTPGIWGTDLAEDYELTERLGGGGSASWNSPQWGSHTLTAGTFFTDTSFLSDSWFESRGNVNKSDGGPSNTGSLSSFVVALDGRDPATISGLSYHLAARHQAEGDADSEGDDENGWTAAMAYGFYIDDRHRLDLLGEYADFSHFNAGPQDAAYLTTGGRLTIDEKWNVSASWTGKTVDHATGQTDNDHLIQLSGGYAFESGIQVDAGIKNEKEASDSQTSLGAKMAYEWKF